MKKTPEVNNRKSMGMMLTLAIVMANGSTNGVRCKQKRLLQNVNADLSVNAAHLPQS